MSLLSYIKGLRKGKDAHRIERNAMDDPFLSEALEGYDLVDGSHAERIERMQHRLANVTSKRKPKRIIAWSAAAALALLCSLSGYLLFRSSETPPAPVAQAPYKPDKSTAAAQMEYADTGLTSLSTDVIAKVEKPADAINKKVDTERLAIVNDKEVSDIPAYADMPPSASAASLVAPLVMAQADKMHDSFAVDTAHNQTVAALTEVSEATKMKQEKLLSKREVEPAKDLLPGKVGSAKGKLIRGRVVDNSGEPIPYAAIVAKGTTKGTNTDASGYFVLSDVEASKLVASFLGFDSKEVAVDTTRPMLIALNESQMLLEEVVVAHAYSSKRYEDEDIEVVTQTEPAIGFSAYKRYLKDALIRPTDKECANVKGRVVVQFEIDYNGNPYNVSIRKSLCESADQEAMRLVMDGARWTKASDKPVRVTVRF